MYQGYKAKRETRMNERENQEVGSTIQPGQ